MILLICLVSILICDLPAIKADCIWYGHSHQEGPHWKNKAYNGTALALNNAEAEAVFQRRCPTLYKEYKGENGEGMNKKKKIIQPNIYIKIILSFKKIV